MRRALLPWLIAAAGREVSIGMGTILTKTTIEIGSLVYIGRYCILGDVRIKDKTLISDYVRLVSGQHGIAPERSVGEQAETYRTLGVGEDAWVGSGATVLADLGNHCVVGAGSVVTKPVADYAIVVGNPARAIGDRRDHKAKDL
jgi:acetyltransferase-like isoleucine patch superfamily enzyme